MRAYTAFLGTETNTFAPIPTGFQSFVDLIYLSAAQMATPEGRAMFGPVKALDDRMKERGFETAYGPAALAQPGGPTTRGAYERLRGELLDALKSALPVDAVVLSLHGAMVADGYLDCEGDILRRVRHMVGSRIPIGVALDPHCHISDDMVEYADIIICYKEYPHTDIAERAFELIDLIADTASGRIRPVMSVYDCGIISMFHTPVEPVRSFIDVISAMEGKDDILSVSPCHGFPWGDTPDMGTKMLVVTDDAPDKGAALAERLGKEFAGMKDLVAGKALSIDAAIDKALSIEGGPVVMADVSDNPGGGAPSDSTFILRALLDRGVDHVAVGLIWDPHAVRIAWDAGEGAKLRMRIGGKTSALSGDPVDLDVTVTRLLEEGADRFAGIDWSMGPVAAVRHKDTDLVLTTNRIQCFNPHSFAQVGIDIGKKKIVVVKSSQHFYAEFAPRARDVIYVDAPGVMVKDLKQLPFKHIQRPKWPFDHGPAK